MIRKNKLREKDIESLSQILSIPVETLMALSTRNLLDTSEARNVLIEAAWKRLKQTQQYNTNIIIEAIAKEFRVSNSTVEGVIYRKKLHLYFCKECDTRISKAMSIRNGQLCNKCAIKSIEV